MKPFLIIIGVTILITVFASSAFAHNSYLRRGISAFKGTSHNYYNGGCGRSRRAFYRCHLNNFKNYRCQDYEECSNPDICQNED